MLLLINGDLVVFFGILFITWGIMALALGTYLYADAKTTIPLPLGREEPYQQQQIDVSIIAMAVAWIFLVGGSALIRKGIRKMHREKQQQ
jgi:hypothetical protein